MINVKKKEMMPLTNKEIKSYEKQKLWYICERFCDDKNKKSEYELYHKVRDHCHSTRKFKGAAHNTCNLRYNVPKKILIVFQNGWTYDYHFVIKKLAEEFKSDFEKNLKMILINHFNDPKTFIEYSNDMLVYKNIDDYNPDKENKILIVFDMNADTIHN